MPLQQVGSWSEVGGLCYYYYRAYRQNFCTAPGCDELWIQNLSRARTRLVLLGELKLSMHDCILYLQYEFLRVISRVVSSELFWQFDRIPTTSR